MRSSGILCEIALAAVVLLSGCSQPAIETATAQDLQHEVQEIAVLTARGDTADAVAAAQELGTRVRSAQIEGRISGDRAVLILQRVEQLIDRLAHSGAAPAPDDAAQPFAAPARTPVHAGPPVNAPAPSSPAPPSPAPSAPGPSSPAPSPTAPSPAEPAPAEPSAPAEAAPPAPAQAPEQFAVPEPPATAVVQVPVIVDETDDVDDFSDGFPDDGGKGRGRGRSEGD